MEEVPDLEPDLTSHCLPPPPPRIVRITYSITGLERPLPE